MAVKREQVVQTAEKYVARGKIEPAIREYRKLLEDNPNDINTLNRVGDLYARIQRIDEAVDFFNQIAEQYAGEGFFVKAIAIYKKIIKLDPTRLDVYENLAELYHRQGLVTEARTQYQVLADYYQKHENATSTIAIYQKMAQLEPNNPTYHVKLAELYHQQQLIEKAMGEYRIIAELMIAHGHPQEAAQVYERSLAIDSTNIAFITDAALKLKEAAGTAIAARFLAAAVERNPAAAQVARLIGGGPTASAAAAAAFAAGLGGTHAGVAPAAPGPPPAAAVGSPLGETTATPQRAQAQEPAEPGAAPAQAAASAAFDLDQEVEFEIDLGADLLLENESPEVLPEALSGLRWPAGEPQPPGRSEPARGFEPAFEIEEEPAAARGAAAEGLGAGEAHGGAAGGEAALEDVFVLDIEDDEEPASLVKPPPDMLQEPRRPAWAQDAAIPPVPTAVRPSTVGPPAPQIQPPPPPPATPRLPRLPRLPSLTVTGAMELVNPFALLEQGGGLAPPARPPLEDARPVTQPEQRPRPVEAPPEAAPAPAPAQPAAPPAEPPPDVDMAPPSTTATGSAPAVASVAPSAAGVPPSVGEEIPAAAATPFGAAEMPPAAFLPDASSSLAEPPAPPAPSLPEPPAIKIDSELLERTAAELQPAPIERYEDLVSEAEVLAKYGLEQKAIERLREAVRLKPRQFAAYLLLIQLYFEKGRHARVIELANQVSRLSEAGDREPWAKLRKRLLSAGYRLDGDRVAAGPETPGALEAGVPRRPVRPRAEAPPAAEAATGTAAPGTGEAAAEISAPPAMLPAPPAAPAAAAPSTVRRPRKASDAGIDQMLRGLIEQPRAGRAAKKPGLAPPAATAPSAAPPPAATAEPPAATFAAAIPEAPAAISPPPAVLLAPPGVAPLPAPPPPLPAPAAVAGQDLIELPPLLAAGEAAPPPEVAPGEIFNPLEIGAMVEREEIDWDDGARPAGGFGAGQEPSAMPGFSPLASATAGVGPPASAAAPSGAAALDDTGMSWLDEADSGKRKSAARGPSLFDQEADFFDLAGELDQELAREPVFQADDMMMQQEQSLEEIVEGFKRGVAEHLSPTDYDTHFNLGIAYREMGLLDEAIGEFQLSAKDARYLVSCCSMLGLCFLDKGLPELAVKWYRRGLEAESLGEDDTLGLLYDMGCAYLTMGDKAAAYKTFVDAYGINTHYRDVVARIEELGRPH